MAVATAAILREVSVLFTNPRIVRQVIEKKAVMALLETSILNIAALICTLYRQVSYVAGHQDSASHPCYRAEPEHSGIVPEQSASGGTRISCQAG